jgi:glycosyltransferase involved in cell wall biosynthesis
VDAEQRGEGVENDGAGPRADTVTMAAPAVSVVMTAYNRAGYIAAAIESVLAQRFTDLELIVVDDKSTDGTVDVVRRYLGDPRVRLEVNDRNLGDYPNRNHAATFARGEYLKYHDSDDLMYPHCLEVMVGALRAAPSAAIALTSGRDWPGGPAPMLLTPRLAFAREYLGYGLFHVGPAGALFRRQAFFDLGCFPEAGVHSDRLFWLSACTRVDVLLVCGDLFWYRVHAGQELRTDVARRDGAKLEGRFWAALADPSCPLDPSERELAKRNTAAGFAKHIIRDVRAGRWSLALFRLRHCGLSFVEWARYLRVPRRSAAHGTPPAAEASAVR